MKNAIFILFLAGTVFSGTGLMDIQNRFLADSFPSVKLVPSVSIIDSFENMTTFGQDWDLVGVTCTQSASYATQGQNSMKVVFANGASNLHYKRGSTNWDLTECRRSQLVNTNDSMKIDIYNPGSPLSLRVQVAKKNFTFNLAFGANTVTLATDTMRTAAFRSTSILNRIYFYAGTAATLYFDNFRWVGPGIGENLIAYAKCFDFGNSVTDVRPYFLPVYAMQGYSALRGYGFQTPSLGGTGSHDMVDLGASGRSPFCELTYDYVDRIQSPFLVDLPNGRYRMHVVETWQGWHPNVEFLPGMYDFSVKINDGATVLLRSGATSFAEFARHMSGTVEPDILPGDDEWAPSRARFTRPFECDFDVTSNQAKFEFLSNWAGNQNVAKVAFMILYPVAKALDIEPEIAALWRDMKYRFNYAGFAPLTKALSTDMQAPCMHPEFDNLAVFNQRLASLAPYPAQGFVVYSRGIADDVYPETVPAPTECTTQFKAFGSPGEMESYAVDIFSFKDFTGATLTVSDFLGSAGAKIPKESCDVRVVNYTPEMVTGTTHGDWRYMHLGYYIVKRDTVDIRAKTSRRFWINTAIPRQATPGTYHASAFVTGDHGESQQVDLELVVLPFSLAPVPADVEYSGDNTTEYFWTTLADVQAAKFIEGKGVTTDPRWSGIYAQALAAYGTRLQNTFSLLKRYGYTAVRGLPKLGDSYLTPQRLCGLTYETVAKANARPVPTEGSQWESYFNLSIRYEIGLSRFETGFFMWKTNANQFYKGLAAAFGDFYMPFDGHAATYGNKILPSPRDWSVQNTTTNLEGIREGIKDYRYLTTLTQLIADSLAAGNAKAQAAKNYMDSLQSQMSPVITAYTRRTGAGTTGEDCGTGHLGWLASKQWSTYIFTSKRIAIANHIAKILGQDTLPALSIPTNIADKEIIAGERFSFCRRNAYAGAEFEYQIPSWSAQTPVQIKVFNIFGKEIATVIHAVQKPGMYRVHWSGTDNTGKDIASGIYYVSMHAGAFAKTVRLAIAR